MAEAGWKVNGMTIWLVVVGFALQAGFVWLAAWIYYAPVPQLAVFDPDKSIERFVAWSSGNVDDAQFAQVLEGFGGDVEKQLALWSQSSGVAVVLEGSVIASGDTNISDWTDAVVREVLK